MRTSVGGGVGPLRYKFWASSSFFPSKMSNSDLFLRRYAPSSEGWVGPVEFAVSGPRGHGAVPQGALAGNTLVFAFTRKRLGSPSRLVLHFFSPFSRG